MKPQEYFTQKQKLELTVEECIYIGNIVDFFQDKMSTIELTNLGAIALTLSYEIQSKIKDIISKNTGINDDMPVLEKVKSTVNNKDKVITIYANSSDIVAISSFFMETLHEFNYAPMHYTLISKLSKIQLKILNSII